MHRADNHLLRDKGCRITLGLGLTICLCVQNRRWQMKLLFQFQSPLFSDLRRAYNEDAPVALSPTLANHEAGFDGLAETNLVSQQYTF